MSKIADGFHSTKEGFKGPDQVSPGCRPDVSIPPRKVSRSRVTGNRNSQNACFHSTKEGFKGVPSTLFSTS